MACFNGQDAVVSELIDYGANVSQANNKGFTPLHFAAASTHGALCLEFLVNNGAEVNVQVQRNIVTGKTGAQLLLSIEGNGDVYFYFYGTKKYRLKFRHIKRCFSILW